MINVATLIACIGDISRFTKLDQSGTEDIMGKITKRDVLISEEM